MLKYIYKNLFINKKLNVTLKKFDKYVFNEFYIK